MSRFKSGIYKIVINDYYIYIGQSMDIENRWKQHLSKLKQSKHYNKKFQSVYDKYPNTIKFEIIEECNENELDSKEIYYIGYYNSYNIRHGLNMGLGGDSNRKYKTIEEMETARKQRYQQRYQNNLEKSKQYCKQWYRKYKKQDNILSCKEKFEKRYNLSRSLTDKEWNVWTNNPKINGKNNFGKYYAIKFLKTLPNLTFFIPNFPYIY